MSIGVIERSGNTGLASTQDREKPGVIQSIPALTGMRGVAVLLVLIQHIWLSAHYENAYWGNLLRSSEALWIGVDLFFALSGFLITGVLLRSISAPSYYRTFYTRRCLRIVPLYFVIIAALFLTQIVIYHGQFCRCLQSSPLNFLWAATFLTNIIMFRNHSWGFNLGRIQFNHAWSLSVEEHFYFIWPLVVRKLTTNGLIKMCLAGLISEVVLRCIYFSLTRDFNGISFLTLFRLDGFFAGALAAALYHSMDRKTSHKLFGTVSFFFAFMLILVTAATHLYRGNPLMLTFGYSNY